MTESKKVFFEILQCRHRLGFGRSAVGLNSNDELTKCLKGGAKLKLKVAQRYLKYLQRICSGG